MLGVYTIVSPGAEHGWGSATTLAFAAGSLVLLALFVWREATARQPLMPLRVFRSREIVGANTIQALLVAGMFGTFFLGSLYLQRVLHYDPLKIGLAFLPTTVVMLLLGLGVGSSFPALMTLAMADAAPQDAGLASGLVNTSAQVGGALGLAVLATAIGDAQQTPHRRRQAAGLGADERLPRGVLDRRGARRRRDRHLPRARLAQARRGRDRAGDRPSSGGGRWPGARPAASPRPAARIDGDGLAGSRGGFSDGRLGPAHRQPRDPCSSASRGSAGPVRADVCAAGAR
jgi:hypothetical protein